MWHYSVMKQPTLLTTLKGSLLEHFFPAGWDLAKIDRCCSQPPASITARQKWWHKEFQPVPCDTLADFDTIILLSTQDDRPSSVDPVDGVARFWVEAGQATKLEGVRV